MTTCPVCAGPREPDQRYCEACGRDLVDGTPLPQPSAAGDGPPALRAHWLSSCAPVGSCTFCGSAEIGAEGYCEHCGHRRRAGQDHAELDLGAVAAVTDRGRRRSRNEDAVAIGLLDRRSGDPGPAGPVPGGDRQASSITLAVVCDGVSSSVRADTAARAATDTGMSTLIALLSGGAAAKDATVAAAGAAATAVAALAGEERDPPSCTYLSAVVQPGEVVIGWVGDSRAYWLATADRSGPPARLTADDSLAGQLSGGASHNPAGQLSGGGEPHSPAGRPDPRMLALTRWLGADAGDTTPRLVAFTPPGPGRVLLCTDGLSRYLAEPAELAAAATGDPLPAARTLNQIALDAGGADNIGIAVLTYPPHAPTGESSR